MTASFFFFDFSLLLFFEPSFINVSFTSLIKWELVELLLIFLKYV